MSNNKNSQNKCSYILATLYILTTLLMLATMTLATLLFTIYGIITIILSKKNHNSYTII